ncbi:MAG: hypothetical protein LBV54_06955 [Puniceicoccales bacterium]|jgi:arabinofuranosyltransferase|nr:hypothetical protein [Puniceicoccales bacterium]
MHLLLIAEFFLLLTLSIAKGRSIIIALAGKLMGKTLDNSYWDGALFSFAFPFVIYIFISSLILYFIFYFSPIKERIEVFLKKIYIWILSSDVTKIRFISLLIFFIFITLNAWLCDDAFHANRMSYNLAHGNGFVYNVGERVSASTCPLLSLIVAGIYSIFGHMYLSSVFFNIICSTFAAMLFLKFACKNSITVIFATLLMMLSKCFISFTTSGLENPLLFLFFAFLLKIYFKNIVFKNKQILLFSFIVSLILITRMDNALLAFPLLAFVFWKRDKSVTWSRAIATTALGMLPFVAWEISSILYYGFPFPNTAYAKVGTGYPLNEYIVRGIKYFMVTMFEDLLLVIPPLFLIILLLIKRTIKYGVIACGITLYFIYLIYVGGDFMLGRHNTVPFFISLFSLFNFFKEEDVKKEEKREYFGFSDFLAKLNKNFIIIMFYIVGVQGIAGIFYYNIGNNRVAPYLINVPDYIQNKIETNAPCSERDYFSPYTSFSMKIVHHFFPEKINIKYENILNSWDNLYPWQNGWKNDLKQIRTEGYKGDIIPLASGMLMYFYSGNLYLNDSIALGDPLLARLPAEKSASWRVGHARRKVPEGYRESLQTGENKIKDKDLAEYLDILWIITRSDDLFSAERLKKILYINIGKYDYLIKNYEKNKNAKELIDQQVQLEKKQRGAD